MSPALEGLPDLLERIKAATGSDRVGGVPTSAMPPADFLRECFDYAPETGVLTWRARPDHHFIADGGRTARRWNTCFAGRRAGSITNQGYVKVEVSYAGRPYQVRGHRIAYILTYGHCAEEIDHEDGNRANNRIANLRPATRLQNSRNIGARNGKSLPKGVFHNRGRFLAQIRINGRGVHLGRFDTPEEAHAAYCACAAKIYGEFFNPGGQPK